MTSFRDLAINGFGGFSITLLGTYLINLIRTPALLDKEAQSRIKDLEKERPYVVAKPFPKKLGNTALKKEALDLIIGIKDLYIRETEQRSNESMYGRTSDINASQEQRRKEGADSYLRMETARQEILSVYWKDYQTKAVLLRDELRARLPGVPPRKKDGVFEISYEVGQLGQSVRVEDVASDLEFLAMQIPDEH